MSVFFFNGFSIGATVIIGKYFGAGDHKKLHRAVETTMAATFLLCLLFTAFFLSANDFMLRFHETPPDVFGEASLYLRIYFAGVTGLLLYNMGSGVLRAVGDTKRPFISWSSQASQHHLGSYFRAPVPYGHCRRCYATILAQFISAAATMAVLIRTDDIYCFRLGTSA